MPKKRLDPYDSSGYYQMSSSMTVNPSHDTDRYVSIKQESFQTLTVSHFNAWVIETAMDSYIRKRWWGAIQETQDKSKATKWRRNSNAAKWAKKHGYYVV